MLDSMQQPDSSGGDYNEIFMLDTTSNSSSTDITTSSKLKIINENEELGAVTPCTALVKTPRRLIDYNDCFSETINSEDLDEFPTSCYYSKITPKSSEKNPLSTKDLQSWLSKRKKDTSKLRHNLLFERERNGYDSLTNITSLSSQHPNGPKLTESEYNANKCKCVKCTIAYHEALIKGITDINLIICKKCKLKLIGCKCCLRNRPTDNNSEQNDSTASNDTSMNLLSPKFTPTTSTQMDTSSYFYLENKLFLIKNELLHLNESTNDIFDYMLKLNSQISDLKASRTRVETVEESHYENDNDYELDASKTLEENDEDMYDPLTFIDDSDERQVPIAAEDGFDDNLYQCIDDDSMSLISEIRQALIQNDEMKNAAKINIDMMNNDRMTASPVVGVGENKKVPAVSKLASATNLIISSISNTDSALCVNSLPKMSSSSSCAASVCMSTLDGLKSAANSVKSHYPKLPVRSNTLNCSPKERLALSATISSSGVSSNSSSSANCSIGTSSSLLSDGSKCGAEILRRVSMKSDLTDSSANRISTTSTLSSNSSQSCASASKQTCNEQLIYSLISDGVSRSMTPAKRVPDDTASTSTLISADVMNSSSSRMGSIASRHSSNRNPSFKLEGAIFNRVQNMSLSNKSKILLAKEESKEQQQQQVQMQQQQVGKSTAKLPIYLMRETAKQMSLDSGIYVPSEYEDSFKSSS